MGLAIEGGGNAVGRGAGTAVGRQPAGPKPTSRSGKKRRARRSEESAIASVRHGGRGGSALPMDADEVIGDPTR